ncbi:MAG TPA: Ppx/GppA phosphatase family protein [Polyangiaceae bacterium]|jgi:exopolyphosphatase/guanosine-5'-triphosphate,3'-diphosphate pyrophosphatase|nr:Ppx/GppA phosphatase family protein [Polyangiaceae bacterium]
MAPGNDGNARRVAAIDVGTNTVLLLIATGSADEPRAVLERATITRLGKGVDASGRLTDEAVARTIACLESYGASIRQHGVALVDVVCTSAARDAQNGAAFIELAARAVGTTPRIIAGDEEARLTFDGALSGLDVGGDVTVFDIGGGSTEIIHGTPDGAKVRIASAVSLDVGSVRLTERHVKNDPPLPDELDAIRRDVDKALATLPRHPTAKLVGVAGTITTLAAIEQGLDQYDSSRVHGSRLTRSTVSSLLARLASVPLAERRAISGLEPARADVIVAGAILADEVLSWSGSDDLVVSDRGVRWGLARGLLRRAAR